jgi:hypothetical protein
MTWMDQIASALLTQQDLIKRIKSDSNPNRNVGPGRCSPIGDQWRLHDAAHEDLHAARRLGFPTPSVGVPSLSAAMLPPWLPAPVGNRSWR